MSVLKTGKNKTDIRLEMKEKRDALSKEKKRKFGSEIEKKLFKLKSFKEAETIMFYVTHRSEVPTSAMIKKALKDGKTVAVPKIDPYKKGKMHAVRIRSLRKDLERGIYGIFEPRLDRKSVVDAKEIDLVFVPALAYDVAGYRIGYGKGFYDRWLKAVPRSKRIGLVFNFQVIKKVPFTRKDVPVGLIATEKRVFKTY